MIPDVLVWLAILTVSALGGAIGAAITISARATWLYWRKRLENTDDFCQADESAQAWQQK